MVYMTILCRQKIYDVTDSISLNYWVSFPFLRQSPFIKHGVTLDYILYTWEQKTFPINADPHLIQIPL
jgi:hypothetical protein